MSAVEGLSPAIQKAASDPYNAVSTLMAAAAAFTGNSAAPADSKNVASAVNSFVASPPPRTCPHRVRYRVRRRTCQRASTRPMPSDRRRRHFRLLPRR